MTAKDDCCQSRPPIWAVYLWGALFFAFGWFVRGAQEVEHDCARKMCPPGVTPRLNSTGCAPAVCTCPVPAKDPTQ